MRNSLSKSLLVFALSFSTIVQAAGKKQPVKKPGTNPHQQCGIFQITGYLKKAGNNYFILLAPGSRSETQIVLAGDATNKDPNHPTTLPAEESFITAKIQIDSPITRYRGSAQKISDVLLAVPNEMRGDKGTGLKLLEPKPCIIQGL